jgi:hypothetical protein
MPRTLPSVPETLVYGLWFMVQGLGWRALPAKHQSRFCLGKFYSALSSMFSARHIEWFVEQTQGRQPAIAPPKPRARVQKLTERVVCEARGEGAAHHSTVHGMLEEFKGTVDAHRLDVVPVLYGGADLD